MGKKKEVTIGYKYYLGVHFAICHGPIDALRRITVDLKEVWSGSATGTLLIDKDTIFGGEKAEGGIAGTLDLEGGSNTQLQNAYLARVIEPDIPAYRGVCCAVLRQMYMGTNPYMKKWAFWVQRIMLRSDGSQQWYPSKAAIGADMNPAHILQECLTDLNWGMGYTTADLDLVSFTEAADTLYTEGFGLSIIWDKQATIEDFVKNVLSHIDATLYVAKGTGLFTLKLIRNDYVFAQAPVFDETNIVSVSDYACSTFTELVNSVTVNFWDQTTGNNSSLTVQDAAMVQLQGSTISRTMEYGGVSNAVLASKLAARDLKALSSPIIRCSMTTNRTGASLKPGQVINFSWPDFAAINIPMRVGLIDFGTAEEGTVKVELVQDVFSFGTATYAPPPATEWVPISNAPTPTASQVSIEAPYYTMVMAYGQDDVNTTLTNYPYTGYLLSAAKRPTNDAKYAQMEAGTYSAYKEVAHLDFSPYAELSSAVTPTTTVFAINNTSDWYSDMIAAEQYALIDSELVGVVSWTASTITVKRGVLDTLPVAHNSGSKLYIISKYRGLADVEYLLNDTVYSKLRTVTGQGVLPLTSAVQMMTTMASRAIRPYPPADFKVDGIAFPVSVVTTTGDITISWVHRNRLQQTAGLYGQTDGSISPEAGTTYNLRIYNNGTGALLKDQTGITAGPVVATLPSGTFDIRIQLESVRGGFTSFQKYDWVTSYTLFSGTLLTEGGDQLVTEDGLNDLIQE